ncbi:MAG: family 1 glycosylhydrolase [Acidimicrobiia bacterium]|nr:family 1 glycosylhydrolase [Acidimicrobiia bacterium]
MQRDDFGKDFTWGVASAAWQIEGAWNAHGKSPSVWDHAGHRRRVRGGAKVGDRGIDFFHRYPEDIGLIAELGFAASRFSLSWPRIIPEGTGAPNPSGLAFYDRVIDTCLEHGIEPWLTLYHWDLPLCLHERGGWANRDVIDWFADYAAVCAEAFGDRVTHWMVCNEPNMHALQILVGIFDRFGLHLRRYFTSVHHLNMAIAEAGRTLSALLPADAKVGTTHQTAPMHPFHPTSPLRRAGHDALDALCNGMFLEPLGGRGYPFAASSLLRRYLAPAVRGDDLDALSHRFDFLGIQYYYPPHVVPAPVPGLWAVPSPVPPRSYPKVRTSLGWPVEPRGLSEVLRRYSGHPVADRLVVTENGAAFPDTVVDGRVHDDLRIWYYRSHLAEVLAAQREGVPVDGYFCWSYADNVEWALGRTPRFGLVHIDYDDDFRRTPKDSARWFARFLAGEPDGGS